MQNGDLITFKAKRGQKSGERGQGTRLEWVTFQETGRTCWKVFANMAWIISG